MLQIILLGSVSLIGLSFFILFIRSHKHIARLNKDIAIQQVTLQENAEREKVFLSEIEHIKNQLTISFEDPVTHLMGWRLFEERVSQAMQESDRYQITMAVLYVDIHEFNLINEALGYEKANNLLKLVARRLETCIRKVDSMARMGKDTYAILLGKIAKAETAAIVAQRILQAFREPFRMDEHELYITLAIGIATYPAKDTSRSALLSHANHALRLAKQNSLHTYQFFQDSFHEQSVRELNMHSAFSRDTLLHELLVSYQPIMDTNNGSIFCMDTVLTWQHLQLGLIETQELYTYAEKQGKINLITEWLLQKTCKQFLAMRGQESTPSYLSLSLSMNQLEQAQLVHRISKILLENNFKPEWLMISLYGNETHLSSLVIEKSFKMLKYIGVKIALNYFGTHQSFSINGLKNVSIDFIKLAPTLLEINHRSEKTEQLLEGVVYLANKLSIKVIAQGVQNAAQAQLLKKIPINLLQGSFIAKSVSEREMQEKHAHLV